MALNNPMMTKNVAPVTARWTPISRTGAALCLKRSTSKSLRPKSLTSSTPPMLSVSFIMAFIWALASIARRAISLRRAPNLRAARMNNGRIAMLIRVRCHSSVSMTSSTAIAWIILVMSLTMVSLMALCAPMTSLFSRLISSPTLVWVKKRRDMRCKLV